jgi:hypothetical protein
MTKTQDIRDAVELELSYDPLVDISDITVKNINGEVALNGTVPNFPQYLEAAAAANGLALNDHVRAEQVELDFPGDVGDAGLAGLAGGEVAGFLGLAGAGPVRAVADEGGGGEDLQQERGEREIGVLRGKKPRRCLSRRPAHAGS